MGHYSKMDCAFRVQEFYKNDYFLMISENKFSIHRDFRNLLQALSVSVIRKWVLKSDKGLYFG